MWPRWFISSSVLALDTVAGVNEYADMVYEKVYYSGRKYPEVNTLMVPGTWREAPHDVPAPIAPFPPILNGRHVRE